MLDLHIFTQWLKAKRTGLQHRQFLLLTLPIQELLPILHKVIANFDNTSIISNELCIPNTVNIPLTRYQDFLGQQTDSLIFDARNGFHLNALYGSAGMVKKNGLIVVLLSSNEPSESNYNGLKFSYGYKPNRSYFKEIFTLQVKKHNGASITSTNAILPSAVVSPPTLKHIEAVHINTEFMLSDEQTNIKKDIESRINNCTTNKTISIILGPRGRGKSSLLAHIAQQLHTANNANDKHNIVVVTALHKNQLLAFRRVTSSQHHKLNSCATNIKQLDSNSTIKFYAPDEIIARAPASAIVVIDEVASIAPELIKNIINHFTHCLLTGTASGYEGSGKGFIHRMLPYLQNSGNTQIYSLNKPFRWLERDPVEDCLDNILCASSNKTALLRIDNNNHKAQGTPQQLTNTVQYKLIDKVSLVNNEQLYSQVFTLLSEAHYQTTPNDIVRTLDSPDCKIVVAFQTYPSLKLSCAAVLGVAILFEEGTDILSLLAKDISLGKRRVQGHLTPQALAMYLFNPKICTHRFLRVNRIAVNSEYTSRGLGSQLLHFCEKYAQTQGINCMSVSYGYTPSLYQFWVRNHFTLAKMGHRIDTASGTSSILMIKPLNSITELDAKLVNFRIRIEQQYISLCNKRLATTYSDLFNKLKDNAGDNDLISRCFTNKALAHYISGEINFTKMAPILLWLIQHSVLQLDEKSRVKALTLLIQLHQKSVPKSQRQAIENNLMAITKQAVNSSVT
jgi:tRNA(Met) cytidine acetyltransferase